MFVFLCKGMEWGKAGQYLKIGIFRYSVLWNPKRWSLHMCHFLFYIRWMRHGLHSRYPLVWSGPSVCAPLPSLFLFDKSLFYRSFLMAGNDLMSYSD